MLNSVRRFFSRPRPGSGHNLILTFHRVRESGQPLDCYDSCPSHPLHILREVVEGVARNWEIVPLRELPARMSPQRRLAAITFDDGWRDTFDLAIPQLDVLGMPATVFVTTGKIGESIPFWQQVLGRAFWLATQGQDAPVARLIRQEFGIRSSRPLSPTVYRRCVQQAKAEGGHRQLFAHPDWASLAQSEFSERLFMNATELRSLVSRGHELGSHTVGHPLLPHLSRSVVATELTESRRVLQELTGTSITSLAYPNGSYDRGVVQVAREEGYTLGCTTAPYAFGQGHDLLTLPRVEPPWDAPRAEALAAQVSNWMERHQRV